jgi:hypothetical protein
MVCYFHIHCRREQVVLLHVLQAMIYDSVSGRTNLRHLVTQVSKLYAVAPNISSINIVIFLAHKMCITSLTPSRNHQMTKVHRSLQSSRSSACNFFYVVYNLEMAPRFLIVCWSLALNCYTACCLKTIYSSKHTLAFHVSELDIIAICTIWLVLQLSIKQYDTHGKSENPYKSGFLYAFWFQQQQYFSTSCNYYELLIETAASISKASAPKNRVK